jgi:hypothetical protein
LPLSREHRNEYRRIGVSADVARADVKRPDVASLAMMLDHKAIGF